MAVMAQYTCSGRSDPGRRRRNNEDRYHADPERGIFFVVDGVGGQAAGETAADTAVRYLLQRLERPTGSPAARIREAITLANNEIYSLAQTREDWHGMACVLTVVLAENGEITVGQVGDSRLYMLQSGQIRKITHDHSPVGEREDRGEIDELTAMRHPRRNEVYRDVGTQPHEPEDPGFIEVSTVPFPPDAALLLCSDGLSDLVTSKQILAIVSQRAGNPDAACRALIEAANDAGGKDNITVVVVEKPGFAAAARRPVPTALSAPPPEKRSLASVLLLLLAGAAIAAAAFAILRPHWRATDSGNVLGWGSVREPRTWRTATEITPALREARPGDTVLVAPGTYTESLRLPEGVRLVSERPGEAVIRSSGVAISAEGVQSGRIEGFRITPDDSLFLQTGIQLIHSAVEVLDNEITGTVTAGIELEGSPGALIRANRIDPRSRAAVVIAGDGPGPRLAGNDISADGFPAIVIAGTARPVLAGNVIRAAQPLMAPPSLPASDLLRGNTVPNSQSKNPERKAPPRNAPTRVR